MSLKQYQGRILGTSFVFNGPDSVAAIEAAVGKKGVVEEAFMTQYVYHDRGPEMRAKVAEKLQESTGIERATKTIPGKDGAPDKVAFSESENVYIGRLLESKVITEADVSAAVNEANEEIGDWSVSTTSRNAKPRKEYYDKADSMLAAIAAGRLGGDGEPATAEKSAQKIGGRLGVVFESVYGDFNRDNIARALRDVDDKAKQEAAQDLL